MSRQNENNVGGNSGNELFSDSSYKKRIVDKSLDSGGNKNYIDAVADDVEDYFFTTSRVKKKKVIKDISYSSDDDTIVVRSNTTNRMRKRHKNSKHRHKHRHRKMKLWKKILIGVACVFLSLVLLLVGTVYFLIQRGSSELFNTEISVSAPTGITVQENGKYVVYNGDTYKFNDTVTNILCMGVDKREIDSMSEVNGTGGQADVIILASIDTSTGKIKLINISREAMTDVTIYSAGGSYVGSERQQLCLAYAYGDGKELSCENTVSAVKKLFYNIPINTYFAMDLNGISAINDCIGGVDVVSPETIGEFTEGESYHLMDGQAESFVRSRDMNNLESNNLRMQRQQEYLRSFMDKVIAQTKEDILTPIDLYNESAPYSCTNLSPSKVMYLAQSAVTNGSMSIDMLSVPGDVRMGEKYAEFIVNEDAFYELFLSVFYTKV